MSESLPYEEIEIWHGHLDLYLNNSEAIINTSHDSDIGYFSDVDLIYPGNMKEKTKTFPFCPEIEVLSKDKNNDYMKKIKLKIYTEAKKLIYDWTDKKNFLIVGC